MKYDVILTAAGRGTRSGLTYNKVFVPIVEKPCICYSLRVFLLDPDVANIFITIQPEDEAQLTQILTKFNLNRDNVYFVYGGKETRQQSIYAGLKQVKSEYVFIHDAARPFIRAEQLEDLKKALRFDNAAILAIPATDTLKEITATKEINRTVNRERIYYAQTPQVFKSELILKCHEVALAEGFEATDDAQLVEVYGEDEMVQIVLGSKNNLKITTPEDLLLAEFLETNRRKGDQERHV